MHESQHCAAVVAMTTTAGSIPVDAMHLQPEAQQTMEVREQRFLKRSELPQAGQTVEAEVWQRAWPYLLHPPSC